VKSFTIAVDEKANSVTITGTPEKIALAKKLIEEIDKPAKPGDPPLTVPDPELRKYSVPAGTAEAVAKKIQEAMPSVRAIALTTTNEVLVLATRAEHAELVKKLKLGGGGDAPAVETAVIPLVR